MTAAPRSDRVNDHFPPNTFRRHRLRLRLHGPLRRRWVDVLDRIPCHPRCFAGKPTESSRVAAAAAPVPRYGSPCVLYEMGRIDVHRHLQRDRLYESWFERYGVGFDQEVGRGWARRFHPRCSQSRGLLPLRTRKRKISSMIPADLQSAFNSLSGKTLVLNVRLSKLLILAGSSLASSANCSSFCKSANVTPSSP